MKCPRCQQENPPQAKFCLECATPLALRCQNCGTQLPAGAKFCFECATPVSAVGSPPRLTSPDIYTPKYLAERILTSKTALEGERKQVTVLFADLKGSMELLADRDPEEARKILDPVLELMMEAVHRFEGTVNQVLGDGIMALFGAPLAHEDHAVRACYAALRMQESVTQYAESIRRAEGIPIQIRVGMNSGEVVVRSIGSDLRMDYSAIGQTTHLAARLEQTAVPGSSVLSPDTFRLVEDRVHVKALGPTGIKGLPIPIEIFELVGVANVRSRFQAAASRGLTRFVGRDPEMEQLRLALERAGAGEGQVVAVIGEPGVGKSRLYWEFTHSHRTHGWLVLESGSVSYGKATSYLPIIDLMKAYFQVEARDDLRRIREKITGKLLNLDEALRSALPAFLALFDLQVNDTSWHALDPTQRRQITLDAIKRLLLRESHVQPLVLVFEDLHWIDSETQVVLDSLLDSLPTARVLLLVNYRPEYRHDWGSKTYYRQLQMSPLAPASAEVLLQALLGGRMEVESLAQLLIQRAGGNPFFLEESVRTLVETGVLIGDHGDYRLAKGGSEIQVPSTVQAVLAARIDRLPQSEKRLLQCAAVIGKDVPLVLLQAISDVAEPELRQSLNHLQAAEFVYETQLFPELEYTFKHALTQEVTYGSVLQERRRVLHARVVSAVEQVHAGRLEEQLERLGHHAIRGEVWGKAADYLYRAGAKAFRRSALRDASGWYDQARGALDHLPQTDTVRARAIDIRFELRNCLMQMGEFARVKDYLFEAEARATALGDQRRLGQALSILANYHMNTGDLAAAMESGGRALQIAQKVDDFGLSVMVSLHLGWVYCVAGNCERAQQILATHLGALTGNLATEHFGLAAPASVLLRSIGGQAQAELGLFNQGIESAEEGVRLSEERGRALDRAYAYRGLCTLYVRQGQIQKILSLARHGLDLAEANGIRIFIPWFASQLAYAEALAGNRDRVAPLVEQVDATIASQTVWTQSLVAIWSGEACLRVGRIEEASRLARSAAEHAKRHSQRGYSAWASWLLGEISMAAASNGELLAGEQYHEALAAATSLGMRPLIAHCRAGLANVYRRIGKPAQSDYESATATTMYREMDMTYWLTLTHDSR